MNAAEVVLELLGVLHALSSFTDILHAECMKSAATDTLHIKVECQWALYTMQV